MISPVQIRLSDSEILSRPKEPATTLAREYGVHHVTISNVRTGQNWGHVLRSSRGVGQKSGELGGGAKLTNAQAAEIRRRRVNERGSDLAREFGVSHSIVSLIWRGKHYKDAEEIA